MKKIFTSGLIALTLLTTLNAKETKRYTNCEFKVDKYTQLCKELVEEGVDVHYVNTFLLSHKTKKIDQVTLRAISPKKIKAHRKAEKKANNVLLKRIDNVVKHLKDYKEVYDEAERRFGVNREIIAGILMKETHLGTFEPKHDAFESLNTIYLNINPDTKRNKWLYKLSKNNLKSLIKYSYKKGLTVYDCNFKSSYIGAVGISQFMPMNFHLIVPYKQSSKYSLLDNLPDAIMSTANYMNKRAKFNKLFDFSTIEDFGLIENNWYEFAYNNSNSSFTKKGDRDCFSCNVKSFDELGTYIDKLMRYNNSSNYAVGVFSLAWHAWFASQQFEVTLNDF